MAGITHSGNDQAFPEEMKITQDEIDRRKAFLEFRKQDAEALKALNEIGQKSADAVIDALYDHFLSFEETKAFFRERGVLERVKRLQKEYFLRLTQGDYGDDYVANRLAVHERINLEPKWYLGAYNFYLHALMARLLEAFGKDPHKAVSAYLSLMKLVFLDIGLAVDTYIHGREKTVRQQQEAIRELSTPVLQIRDRLLLLPIVGVIDTRRARLITENLLHAIRTTRAKAVVVDITGVSTIDSKVANHLLQTVAAAGLMGASVVVTGLSPDVAQSLVALGIDLSKIKTVGDLQGGIDEADRIVGYRVVRVTESGGAQPA